MKCPACGNNVRDGVPFCPRCGKYISGNAPESDAGRSAVMKCPACGNEIRNDVRHCPMCGKYIPGNAPESDAGRSAVIKCPACGNEIRNGVRFCPRCGKSVSGKAPESNVGRAVRKPSGTNPVQDKSGTGQQSHSGQLFSIDAMLKQMKRDAVKNGKTDPEGVLARMEQGIREAAVRLGRDAACINIINAGRMNHGKSSLLNSLMDSDVFKVNDVRETVVNRRVKYRDSIFFTDTPGLEANAEDDSEAFNIYSSANFILFVHTLRIGELHSEEISYLKRLCKIFPRDYLKTHMAIALTFVDSYKPDEIQAIREKIKDALASELGMDNIRFFEVSNSRYKKYQEEISEKKKQAFLKGSGICEIREFITKQAPVWQSENRALRRGQFKFCKEKCKEIAASLSPPLNARLKAFRNVYGQVNAIEQKLSDSSSAIDAATARLNGLRARLAAKKRQWNEERY